MECTGSGPTDANQVKRIQCFLKDADKRQDEDDNVRNWVSEIRDADYDIEDVIDSFVLKFAPGNGRRIHNPVTKGIALHNLASKIDEIKSRIIDLTRSLQTYGITARKEGEGTSLASETQRQLRWSYSHVVEESIVRFDEDIRQLITQLVNEEKCIVVFICGMGGLGKTTMARAVYHHGDIRRHFEGFAWAYVSQQCKRRCLGGDFAKTYHSIQGGEGGNFKNER